jgi:hypothetical protein
MSKNSEYFKKWYEQNKEIQYQRIQDRKKRIRDEVREYKESSPCMDCNISYPHFVMDFDHREPHKKEYNISSIINSGSIKKIWTEIKKCDLVCANCHRLRTWNRY